MHTDSSCATGVCVTKIGRRWLKINSALGGVWDCRRSAGVEIMRGTGKKTRCEERERQGAENGRGVADKDGEISVKVNGGEQTEGWEERDRGDEWNPVNLN